jgi:hypothetical protein
MSTDIKPILDWRAELQDYWNAVASWDAQIAAMNYPTIDDWQKAYGTPTPPVLPQPPASKPIPRTRALQGARLHESSEKPVQAIHRLFPGRD